MRAEGRSRGACGLEACRPKGRHCPTRRIRRRLYFLKLFVSFKVLLRLFMMSLAMVLLMLVLLVLFLVRLLAALRLPMEASCPPPRRLQPAWLGVVSRLGWVCLRRELRHWFLARRFA